VWAGGPTATHPEPVAPFFDAILLDEAEEALPGLLLFDAANRRAGLPRAERLARLAERGGVYVPSLYATRFDPRSRRGAAAPARAGGGGGPRAPPAPAPAGVAADGRRPQPAPVPRRHAGALGRGRVRPGERGDRARLHRGLSLLPGGHDLPAGARAGSRRHRR